MKTLAIQFALFYVWAGTVIWIQAKRWDPSVTFWYRLAFSLTWPFCLFIRIVVIAFPEEKEPKP